MPDNTPASGITISFTREEVEWLNWVMINVLKGFGRGHTAKDKIISAHDLIALADEAKNNQDMGAG